MRMETTKLAYSRLAEVLEMYGLPKVSNKHAKECPICGKKDKFRLTNYKGQGDFICTCNTGNLFKLIELVHGLDFKQAAKEIDEAFGNVFVPMQQPKRQSRLAQAMERVKSSSKVKGSNVEAYLRNRGIYELPTKGLFSSNVNMYVSAVDQSGNPVYQHETFLDGDKKANVEVQKKMLKLAEENQVVDFGVVRLFDSASTLGIAEGIETALSCRQIYKCNIWSTLNSQMMKKFRAPSGVKHLMIFADNDKNGTGLAAAFECGSMNIKANNDVEKVTIRWPGDQCDFNDMILNGSNVFEWQLSR